MKQICGDCLHYYACAAWNIGSLANTEAGSCVNYTPAANVVEVVRCKDCMFWYRCPGKREVYACEVGGMNCILNGEGFCSRAKRGKSFMRED